MFHFFEEDDKKIITGLTDELKSIYVLNQFKKQSILLVTNSLYEANKLYSSLANYTKDVCLFPMDDFLTSEALAISPDLKYTRLETLEKLMNDDKKIVITNLMGYLRFLPSKETFKKHILSLKKDTDFSMKELIKALVQLGYTRESMVNKTGEFSERGFVLDIFPVNQTSPIRIEYWGDTIDTIKEFDIDTQRSQKEINQISIFTNTEFLIDKEVDNYTQKDLPKYGEVVNITQFLNHPLVIFNHYSDIEIGYKQLQNEITEYNSSKESNDKYMFSLEELQLEKEKYFEKFDQLLKKEEVAYYESKKVDNFSNSIEEVNQWLTKKIKEKYTIVFCLENRYTINKIIEHYQHPDFVFTKEDEIFPNKINLIIKKINEGFIFNQYIIVSEKEIFNRKDESSYHTKFKYGKKIRDITKLEVGDYVVHTNCGIGKYIGIKSLNKNGLKKDYLQIEYDGGDKLYIPVEKIELLSKFSSNDGIIPKLNKLGTTEWQKTKLKVQKKIEDIADDLLKLYKERENMKGFAFLEDTKEQYEFEEEFPFELTKDQEKVIVEIKKDMEKNKPMDRLLCGDVGYGKTEVAFRAIFKAIYSGKQAVILCPTTILSSQHYQNAIERFKKFPVKIVLLNRFVTGARLSKTVKEIETGEADLIIGTHKVLGLEVVFKDLGLLIIDEEQRFGVKQKERIKQYKSSIDVLTLSATPIPRTLQMSMSGLRTLSLLETPPNNRYPVQTYVLEESNQIIKDAIYKELSRKGQIFLLYNHVDSIERKAEEIRNLVPDARITYAHGRMSKDEIEDVMYHFIKGESDILLCTTIIETGIDIPRVNTLIILDADRFGLSQLYQIRGRVGRSDKIAYCYLMYDKHKILSEIAEKRLKVIKEFTELGSGFAIAMRDLSIRGAGDILGKEQSGFIDSVGVELFLNMLNEEMDRRKGKVKDEVRSMPLIDVSTAIDDSYVKDEDIKIEIHKKINQIDSEEKMEEIKAELEDRFGTLSEDMKIYMFEELFENMANKLKIEQIRQTKTFIELTLPRELSDNIDGQKLFLDATRLSRKIRFGKRFDKLLVTLDIVNLDKHFIYYLIDLLKIIEECKKIIDK